MNTVEIKGFVYEYDGGYGSPPSYSLFSRDDMGDQWFTLVGPATFTYALPEGYSAKGSQIARLQAQREAAAKLFSETVRAIDKRLAELQAIEFTEAA
jgi:hypothetical protein